MNRLVYFLLISLLLYICLVELLCKEVTIKSVEGEGKITLGFSPAADLHCVLNKTPRFSGTSPKPKIGFSNCYVKNSNTLDAVIFGSNIFK